MRFNILYIQQGLNLMGDLTEDISMDAMPVEFFNTIQPFKLSSNYSVCTLQDTTCSSIWIALNHICTIYSFKSNLRFKDTSKSRVQGRGHETRTFQALEGHSTTWVTAGQQSKKYHRNPIFFHWEMGEVQPQMIQCWDVRDYFCQIHRKQRAGVHMRGLCGSKPWRCAHLTHTLKGIHSPLSKTATHSAKSSKGETIRIKDSKIWTSFQYSTSCHWHYSQICCVDVGRHVHTATCMWFMALSPRKYLQSH